MLLQLRSAKSFSSLTLEDVFSQLPRWLVILLILLSSISENLLILGFQVRRMIRYFALQSLKFSWNASSLVTYFLLCLSSEKILSKGFMALQLLNCGIRNGYQDANSRRRREVGGFYSKQVLKISDANFLKTQDLVVIFEDLAFFKNQYHEFSWVEEEALEIIAATKSKDSRKIDCCQQSVGKYVWLSCDHPGKVLSVSFRWW